MYVLGIETSCDETSAAIVCDGNEIRSNIIASQTDIHSPYGGVIPELACRRHVEIIDAVVQEALNQAGIRMQELDLVAVTRGPGLVGALLVGIMTAHGLAYSLHIPVIGINHIEAHLYAAVLKDVTSVVYPAVGLVVSGGHTALFLLEKMGAYRILGSTIDDAAGEAFDKVAKLLGLGYPGGPLIETRALQGNPAAIRFPRAMMKRSSLDFSFSGVKTAVLYHLKKEAKKRNSGALSEDPEEVFGSQGIADIAASFQEAVVDAIVWKTEIAVKRYNPLSILVGGGVALNQRLRRALKGLAEKRGIILYLSPPELCQDNGAMVAGLGYHKLLASDGVTDTVLDAVPNLVFGEPL